MADNAPNSRKAEGVSAPEVILHHCVLALGEAATRFASNLLLDAARRKNMNKSQPPPSSRQSPDPQSEKEHAVPDLRT